MNPVAPISGRGKYYRRRRQILHRFSRRRCMEVSPSAKTPPKQGYRAAFTAVPVWHEACDCFIERRSRGYAAGVSPKTLFLQERT
jgi:hypothetical protein